MQKLNVQLEHCYGINKLNHEFDFSTSRTFVIYAPNGSMKTSFAKTFRDISEKKSPRDQIDDTVTVVSNIIIEDSGVQISPDEISVIEPYNEKAFNSEDKILTLLADEKTRSEYLEIFKEIESAKKSTMSGLKKISGSSNYEIEIIESFSSLGKKNIYEIFDTILNEVRSSRETFKFKYNDVFDKNGKVRAFLDKNFQLLQKYIEKYDELLSASDFFAKDENCVFGTTEAKNLESSLSGNEYFDAGHRLSLKSHGEIEDKNKISDIINGEIAKIFNDESLRKIFEQIDKALDANKDLQAFKKVIEKDNSILLRLSDYDAFRRDVWFSFLKQIVTALESLVDLYNSKKDELENIIQKAKDSQSEWETAIKEFQNRFTNVPFDIEVKNKSDAVLNEETPAIEFKFQGKDVARKKFDRQYP